MFPKREVILVCCSKDDIFFSWDIVEGNDDRRNLNDDRRNLNDDRRNLNDDVNCDDLEDVVLRYPSTEELPSVQIAVE